MCHPPDPPEGGASAQYVHQGEVGLVGIFDPFQVLRTLQEASSPVFCVRVRDTVSSVGGW